MYDEDLRQARQALVSENWEDAERQYYYLKGKNKLEADIALAFINLHKAHEKLERKEKGANDALEMAAGKLNGLLDGAEPLHADFILAFAPKVLANLTPRNGLWGFPTSGFVKGIHVKQWLTATLVRNILLNFTFTDNVVTLPEKVQSAICQAIVDLDQYVDLFVRGRTYSTLSNTPYRGRRPEFTIDKNRSADPASYKRCEELRCDADVMEKMKHVYRALGITDASEMSITDEEKKQFNKKQKRNIILVLISAVVIYLTLRWLTML